MNSRADSRPQTDRLLLRGLEDETRAFLERARALASTEARVEHELAVVRQTDGRVIGGVSIGGYAFEKHELRRVGAHYDSENLASARVLDKLDNLGMRREGLFRHDCRIRGVWRDTIHFAILEGERRG